MATGKDHPQLAVGDFGFGEKLLYRVFCFLLQFQGQFGTDWARVLAFVSLSLIPTIIFYLFAERQIVAGLTAGAVKG